MVFEVRRSKHKNCVSLILPLCWHDISCALCSFLINEVKKVIRHFVVVTIE